MTALQKHLAAAPGVTVIDGGLNRLRVVVGAVPRRAVIAYIENHVTPPSAIKEKILLA